MIDKKPPKVSGTDDTDEFEDAVSTSHADSDAEADEDHLRDPLAEEDDYGIDPNDGVSDAEAALRRQKLNGMLVTYGGGALILGVVGFLMWPKYKHMFVSAPPAVVQGINNPMPESARKPYFTAENSGGAGNDATAAGGTDTSGDAAIPSLSNPTPSAASTSPSAVSSANGTATGSSGAAGASPNVPALPPSGSSSSVDTATSPSAPIPSATATGSAPASALPAAPIPSSAPSVAPATDNAVQQKTSNDMQATIDKMTADQETATAKIGQMQAQIDKLQAQLADLATVKAGPSHKPVASVVHHASAGLSHPVAASVHWVLRSATPGTALISRGDSNELQHVAVGDMVTGLGKITSIEEHDGRWVVQGSSGSVSE